MPRCTFCSFPALTERGGERFCRQHWPKCTIGDCRNDAMLNDFLCEQHKAYTNSKNLWTLCCSSLVYALRANIHGAPRAACPEVFRIGIV